MSPVDSWDSGQFGADWDSGLQWDVNVGPSPGDPQPYLDLVTSEHNQRPKYMAMLRATFQPIADIQVLLASMPIVYDLDVAVGVQEDVLGQWIGIGRDVTVPLPGVYFSLDSAPLGLDLGSLQGPGDPTGGLIVLPDEQYRTLLRARIANNQWKGTIDDAYAVWDAVFAGTGIGILIQDLGDMHMILALTGPTPDAITLALFTGGSFNLVPAGVAVDYYITPWAPDEPYFALGAENDNLAGLDVGGFGVETPPA